MKKLLIIAAVGMVLAIAACGPGAEPTPTPTPTPMVVATPTSTITITTATPLATATTTPKRGGILKVRNNTVASTFYVHQISAGSVVMYPVYNGLLAEDPLDRTSEKIVPDLADRWEVSNDGLTITLFLRQGVKWQDAVPFTARDVKYNLDLVRDPPKGFVSPRQSTLEAIASIETPDDKTVVLKLKHISNSIISALANPANVMMPKHVIEKDVLNSMKQIMVGTGPYMFKEFTPEGIVTYERNPSYWKPDLPYLDGIRNIPITDTNAFIAALYTGQIDSGSATGASGRNIGKTDVQRIQKERPELLVQGTVTTLNFMFFALNTKIPPFTDQRVREAVQDAIDREWTLSTSGTLGVVGGFKLPGSFWGLPAQELAKLPGFGPDISARRAHSRQLLKDAGVAAGTEITISAKSSKPLSVEMVELMQLQLQEALPSLNIKIRNYSSAEYDANEAAFSLQAEYESMGLANPDPDNYGVFITTGGSRNYWKMSDPRIDELQAKQSTILDPAQRRLVVWELDKLVIQNGAFVPMSWRTDPCPAWPYVKNQVCIADANGVTGRYEIVWLDK